MGDEIQRVDIAGVENFGMQDFDDELVTLNEGEAVFKMADVLSPFHSIFDSLKNEDEVINLLSAVGMAGNDVVEQGEDFSGFAFVEDRCLYPPACRRFGFSFPRLSVARRGNSLSDGFVGRGVRRRSGRLRRGSGGSLRSQKFFFLRRRDVHFEDIVNPW